MSHDNFDFESSIGIPEDPVSYAVKFVEESQHSLIQATAAWKDLPTQKRYLNVNQQLMATTAMLGGTLVQVFEGEDFSEPEKRFSAVTIVTDLELTKSTELHAIFPDIGVHVAASTVEERLEALDEEIGEDLTKEESGFTDYMDEDPCDVVGKLTSSYANNYLLDIQQFATVIDKTPKAKLLQSRGVIGKHVLDIGKTSAGIALGAIIAHKILKNNS